MVARGSKGKKAGTAVAAEPEAAATGASAASNGDVSSQDAEIASEAIVPAKRGRQRGGKKETKEEADETPPAEVVEKTLKPAQKAAKGGKRTPKGKGSSAASAVEEDEKMATNPTEDKKDEVLSENEPMDTKKAVVTEKKGAAARKRKADNIEKPEDVEAVAKKAPRVTKTKGAKKETVDSDGVPEDPAAAGVSITVLPATQTNGTKKRKRGAAAKIEEPEPVAEEPIAEEPTPTADEPEEEEEIAPVANKKGSKSKTSKKEPKETQKKPTPKSKGAKKAQKVVDEAEEEITEHDVLPEDEFVPELEEEEEEQPKPKKVVKSKGSRKQVTPANEEEKAPESINEDESEEPTASEPQESEADSASAIDEEQATQPSKFKGKKAPAAAATAAKKEKVTAKKATSKKGSRAKKPTKDELQEDQLQSADKKDIKNKADNLNNKNNEENQETAAAADIEPSKRKINGTAKPAAQPALEQKPGRGRKAAQAQATAPTTSTPIDETVETEKKPGRGRKRAAPAAVATAADDDNDDQTDGAKVAKTETDPFNPTKTEYTASDFTLDKKFNMKISSWNIAGLRAWLKKDGLAYLQHEQPDILCLQEIKCTPDQLPEEARIPGYHPYWLCMPGGYAGVAVYSKIMPINVEYGIGNPEFDENGRIITAEYEKFYLLAVYVPNSGKKLINLDKRMEWEELFREYLNKLEKVKPVIIAGDMNVSHKEIDLANPKTNTKNAGFTIQERDAMTKLLSLGYVDTFRHFYPNQKGAYTFWTYMGKARSRNVGWRLDYFILSERLLSKAVESTIRPQVLGSDHCPITLFLNI